MSGAREPQASSTLHTPSVEISHAHRLLERIVRRVRVYALVRAETLTLVGLSTLITLGAWLSLGEVSVRGSSTYDHISLSRGVVVCLGLSATLALIAPLLWIARRLTLRVVVTRLEADLARRALLPEPSRGVISTLALALAAARVTSGPSAKTRLKTRSEQVDPMMLPLLARRALTPLRLASHALSPSPWRGFALGLLYSVALLSTWVGRFTLADIETDHARPLSAHASGAHRTTTDRALTESQEARSRAKTNRETNRETSRETSRDMSRETWERRERAQSAENVRARGSDQRASTPKKQDAPQQRRSSRRSAQDQNQRLEEARLVRRRRASVGGRTARDVERARSVTRQLELSARAQTDTPRRDDKRRDDKRRQSAARALGRGHTDTPHPLSIAESASLYGIRSQLTPADFPLDVSATLD